MNTDTDIQALQRTRHLLQRTGFAESPATVQADAQLEMPALIDARIHSTEPVSPITPPAWGEEPVPERPNFRDMNTEDKKNARKTIRLRQKKQLQELQIWWLSSLVQTKNPLAARMTLFWQNHFTSEQRKVRHTPLMYRQHKILMQHAMGKFGDLLSNILRDPAMLIYLDNRVNRRNKPNENLARELLELFTLGEGHYTEQDIRELAKALTGLTVNKHQEFVFQAKAHDDGEKNLFGQHGKFALDDVISLLLAHPQTAVFLTNKLWRHFISDKPDQTMIEQWANAYRESDYDMTVLLTLLFNSTQFHDPNTYGNLFKSPVEFIVGTHRVLNAPPVEGLSLVRASNSMQQRVYSPPNVRGWVGGEEWINSHTFLARRRFITQMLRNDDVNMKKVQSGMDEKHISAALLPVDSGNADPTLAGHPVEKALRSPAYHLS